MSLPPLRLSLFPFSVSLYNLTAPNTKANRREKMNGSPTTGVDTRESLTAHTKKMPSPRLSLSFRPLLPCDCPHPLPFPIISFSCRLRFSLSLSLVSAHTSPLFLSLSFFPTLYLSFSVSLLFSVPPHFFSPFPCLSFSLSFCLSVCLSPCVSRYLSLGPFIPPASPIPLLMTGDSPICFVSHSICPSQKWLRFPSQGLRHDDANLPRTANLFPSAKVTRDHLRMEERVEEYLVASV